MRVLCIGDIVGSPGRRAVAQLLPQLIETERLDLVIANAENAAGGIGLTRSTADELLQLPIALLTGGNHTWRHKEINEILEDDPRVLRPHNYPDAPGSGIGISRAGDGTPVAVLNLQGRVFMDPLPSPFEAADRALEQLAGQTRIIIVDFHAEATSEKRALGWYLDGRVSALYGTHTHVATADEEILPEGTGYITDIGMTGPYDSVIGMKKGAVLQRFLTMRPAGFSAAKGDVRLCGVIFDIDADSGRTTAIQRVREPLDAR